MIPRRPDKTRGQTLTALIFGEFVKSERERLGIKQLALANDVNCSVTKISRIETGRKEVTLTDAVRILTAMKLNLSDFDKYQDSLEIDEKGGFLSPTEKSVLNKYLRRRRE